MSPQRLWERLINYTMGQLVVLGAVVEPDLPELLLWFTFSACVGVLGLYSGAVTRTESVLSILRGMDVGMGAVGVPA